MKAFIGGIAAMIVISVGAMLVLDSVGFTSKAEFTSERGSVRLGDG